MPRKKNNKDLAIELPEPEIISLDEELSSLCQNYNECSDSSQIRCSAYMVYPDSMDINDIISKISVQAQGNISFLLSPLHDKDKFDNGEPKKPHYHLMMIYSDKSNMTVSRAKRWGQLMGLVGCEIIHNKKGYARYLCHLDSKDKVKYNVDDVKAFNIDYLALIGNLVNKFDIFRDLIDFINENDILFYSDLVDWCKDNNEDWFRSLMGGATFTIEKYIKERRFKASYMERDVVSPKGVQEYEKDSVRMNHFISDLSYVLKNFK